MRDRLTDRDVEIAFLQDKGLSRLQATRAVYPFDVVDLYQRRQP